MKGNSWLPPVVMAGSGLSMYAGAAIAVGLFAQFPPVLVAWFRVAAAGVILTALFRPRLAAFGGRVGAVAAVYGVVTMGMNMAFYQAINLIPLGTAVAIEFLGPVAVAAWGSRRRRDLVALACAVAGVVVISGARWSVSWEGIAWALAAGGLWAGYIVAGWRISADAPSSRTSMAVGFLYAGLAGVPLAVWLWPGGQGGAGTVGLALGLGLLSAAIPYSFDQVVLRLAGASHFALLQAILPLVATLVGAIALRQWLSPAELAGMALVIIAVALRRP